MAACQSSQVQGWIKNYLILLSSNSVLDIVQWKGAQNRCSYCLSGVHSWRPTKHLCCCCFTELFLFRFFEWLGSGHLITSVLWITRDCLFSYFQLISLCYLKREFWGKFLTEELRNILLPGVQWQEIYPTDTEERKFMQLVRRWTWASMVVFWGSSVTP